MQFFFPPKPKSLCVHCFRCCLCSFFVHSVLQFCRTKLLWIHEFYFKYLFFSVFVVVWHENNLITCRIVDFEFVIFQRLRRWPSTPRVNGSTTDRQHVGAKSLLNFKITKTIDGIESRYSFLATDSIQIVFGCRERFFIRLNIAIISKLYRREKSLRRLLKLATILHLRPTPTSTEIQQRTNPHTHTHNIFTKHHKYLIIVHISVFVSLLVFCSCFVSFMFCLMKIAFVVIDTWYSQSTLFLVYVCHLHVYITRFWTHRFDGLLLKSNQTNNMGRALRWISQIVHWLTHKL